MKIYPAIDIIEGRCVRLTQGDYNRVTEFAADPVAVAQSWAAAGAEWIHVVDLDGARVGAPRNGAVIARIRAAVSARLQVGGGLRSMTSIAALLDGGVERIVLGTAALNDPLLATEAIRRWPDRVAVALDTRDGQVMADGWFSSSAHTPREVLLRLAEFGAGVFIYTDISRDGMLAGPNLDALADLVTQAHSANCQMIASGGVSSLADVSKLAALGVDGAIVGKALYTGELDLAAVIVAAGEGDKA